MTRPLRLFHLSDLHFGREDRAALAAVTQLIASERPDAVLITGDLTMRARHREFAAAAEWIGGLGVPVTLEIGNHDMPYVNLVERLAAPLRRFDLLQRQIEQPLTLPGVAVVPLRTASRAQWRWPWVEGWVRQPALERTLAEIDAQPAGTTVLVTAHHPLIERAPDGRRLTIGGEAAMAALAQRGVAAVLSGHVHDPFDLTHQTANGPLRLIGAGTLSTRLRSTPPSFNRLLIDERGLTVSVAACDDGEATPRPLRRVPTGPLPGE